MKTTYTYKILQNIHEDGRNWWSACNKFSHGVNWKKQIDDNLVNKLAGTTKSDAEKILIPFLNNLYIKEKKNIDYAQEFFEGEFAKKFQKGCEKMEEVMKRPIYRTDFTIFLTTLRRGPYNKSKGQVWTCIYWDHPVASFLHELCHFQFIHYWRENPDSEVFKLSNDQFEFLKESLTMILDEDFFPLIRKPDYGYDLHQEFRKELKEFWKKEKDFDKLVEFGTNEIKKLIS